MTNKISRLTALIAGCALAASAAWGGQLQSLTVCADPGNMPLSNQKGEGFENKIAEILGKSLGTGVQYYWRPSVERGLMRTTLSAGNCDLWMDMATDTEGAEVLTPPLYRSTFVLAYRSDKGIDIKSLDAPALKKLRIGVFEVSAVREALMEHNVIRNTVIHYVSHNADIDTENQPSYQVQQVIDGALDVAAVWGPMAGYYKTMKHAPLVIQPVNLMEDKVPMEFDMALAVPRARPDIKQAVEGALTQSKAEIKQVLVDYGVPLVQCAECLISGDLPSHGPYKAQPPAVESAASIRKVRGERMAEMKKALAHGANPNDELSNAIVADDLDRVRYLLQHGAQVDFKDGEGNTPLINAARFGYVDVANYLIEHKADVKEADRTNWTPLMFAAWTNDPALLTTLIHHGSSLETKDTDGLTPLAIASQNGKVEAARVLVAAGANVNVPVAKGGYTPLMLASVSGSTDLADALLKHGAQVNAVNSGGVTALMIAAAGNHSGVAALLLKAGADINARSEDGRTALSIAEANNNEPVIRLLQDAVRRDGGASG